MVRCSGDSSGGLCHILLLQVQRIVHQGRFLSPNPQPRTPQPPAASAPPLEISHLDWQPFSGAVKIIWTSFVDEVTLAGFCRAASHLTPPPPKTTAPPPCAKCQVQASLATGAWKQRATVGLDSRHCRRQRVMRRPPSNAKPPLHFIDVEWLIAAALQRELGRSAAVVDFAVAAQTWERPEKCVHSGLLFPPVCGFPFFKEKKKSRNNLLDALQCHLQPFNLILFLIFYPKHVLWFIRHFFLQRQTVQSKDPMRTNAAARKYIKTIMI